MDRFDAAFGTRRGAPVSRAEHGLRVAVARFGAAAATRVGADHVLCGIVTGSGPEARLGVRSPSEEPPSGARSWMVELADPGLSVRFAPAAGVLVDTGHRLPELHAGALSATLARFDTPDRLYSEDGQRMLVRELDDAGARRTAGQAKSLALADPDFRVDDFLSLRARRQFRRYVPQAADGEDGWFASDRSAPDSHCYWVIDVCSR